MQPGECETAYTFRNSMLYSRQNRAVKKKIKKPKHFFRCAQNKKRVAVNIFMELHSRIADYLWKTRARARRACTLAPFEADGLLYFPRVLRYIADTRRPQAAKLNVYYAQERWNGRN